MMILPALFLAMLGTAHGDTPFGLIISEQLRTSFTLVGAGARAVGMGSAFTAVADDATAASFNPAGLAQLVLPEASIVGDRIDFRDRYRDFFSFDQEPPLRLTDTRTHFHHNGLNFLSLTIPFRWLNRQWAIQGSTQEAVDFTYKSDRFFSETDSSGAPLFDLHQTSNQDGNIRTYSAAFAVEATQRMLLGITINHWTGNWNFSSLNAEAPSGNPEREEYFTLTQANSLSGWNVDLGILLRYRYFNVGAKYRTKFDADYAFSAGLETNIATSLSPTPHTVTRLTWPDSLSIGIAVKPSDRLLLAVDWDRTDWSRMNFTLPGNAGAINFFDLQPGAATSTGVSNNWHAGAEFLLFAGQGIIPVRGGWLREPQPSRDAVTGDRFVTHGYATGIGYKRNWFALDFAFQQKVSSAEISRFLEPDEIAQGKLKATSRGTLQRTQNRFFLSVIFQIPEDSFLRNLLHSIFVGPVEKSHS